MSSFKDHFSAQSADYRRYRPHYPDAMLARVASLAPSRGLAIDCATGTGQAALGLARHFERVAAVDGSAAQLRNASRAPGVAYLAGVAEQLPLQAGCASLLAAAQAAHWFDPDRFFAECRRVLVPGGIVALWTYGVVRISGPVDAVVDRFYETTLGGYWPPERRHVDEGYRSLPFPLERIELPSFEMETDWTLDETIGYLATWSALVRFRETTGADPLPALRQELARCWPVQGRLRLRWPVHLLVGTV